MLSRSLDKFFGGVLLIAGTTIGAAILALPVVTAQLGFYFAIVLFLFIWLLMGFTALLFVEVNLWMEEEMNLVSMAKRTLGTPGEIFSWICYLFLLYSLITAYMAGSGPIFVTAFDHLGIDLPLWSSPLPLLFLFGFFVYQGTKAVDLINRFLMIGLIGSYCILLTIGLPHIQIDHLKQGDVKGSFTALSVIITSFGFHIIIPTLSSYLKKNVQLIKSSLFYGSAISLVVYILWELLVIGTVPFNQLIEGNHHGYDGATLMAAALDRPLLSVVAQFFAFFAMITSFLGVSLSLNDFLADGLQIEKTRLGKILLYFLTFTPPIVIHLTYPHVFLSALRYAGVFGVVTLLILLPALMVWKGRYVLKEKGPYKAPGGKIALLFVIIISFILIGIELVNQL